MAYERDPGAEDRLVSWKEIAQHLAVSVRTAMRWEKSEGLPARRHKHDKLSSVYASRAEIDRWWTSRPDLREQPSPGAPELRRASLAVLPFLNLTGNEDGEILADGLTEELITLLAQVPGLRVVARTSSFYFKGKAIDVRTIAGQLGVSALLEGSIRVSGNRLRVAAQLIGGADGFHLWSDQFDRPMQDLLEIQSSIACAIVSALQIRLAPDTAAPVRHSHGGNAEAYRFWLKGRYHLNRLTPRDALAALQSFEEALACDPRMAPAFAGIGQCCFWLANLGALPVAEAVSRARQAAAAALAVDERCADAHLSLALMAMGYEYDWGAADREFRRALELNPACADAHVLYAGMLGAVGRSEASHTHQARAYELDPISANVLCGMAADQVFARGYGEALRFLDRALELQPELPVIYYWLSMVYLMQRDYGRLETICLRVPLPHLTAGFLGNCYAHTGRRDDAWRIVRQLEAPAPGPSPALQLAILQLGLDNHDAAIAALDAAREHGCFGVHWLAIDPIWDPLRGNAKFTAVLRKINLA